MFWDNVKEKLKTNNLSLKNLSDTTELNYRTLQNQIGRNIIPDAITSVKIAQSLGTTVEFLVTGEENNSAEQELKELKAKLRELCKD